MRPIVFSLFFLLLINCSEYVERPADLISADKMAEILADMALNDQTAFINPTGNQEAGTRFILKKHQIKAANFSESYKYYVVTKRLDGILDQAQQKIRSTHPEAPAYIDTKIKEKESVLQDTP